MALPHLLAPALVPAAGVGLTALLLGHGPVEALVAAGVGYAGGLATAALAERRFGRGVEALASAMRERASSTTATGLPRRALPHALAETAGLELGIEALHSRLESLCTRYEQDTRTLVAVLDSMEEGIWLTDAEGTVVRHNRALLEMLRPPSARDGMVGQRPLALLRHEGLDAAVTAACRQGIASQLELTLEGLLPRTLALRVTPLGRDLPGSSAVFHDVTELRRLEKVRKDFVANVSHELRTPITAIRGYAETLQAGALADGEVAARMVNIIHRQSERLSELVEDLLEISRLESRELKLTHEPVNVAEAARRALETVRLKAGQKDVRVTLRVHESLQALGDSRAVEQVLLNLLDNAVKYTPAGGQVELTGTHESGRCVVVVSDTGVGIEARHLTRVFERFYRVDKGRSRDLGGTGLGLSIVKHLVSAMDGEVDVSSQPGVGSAFTVLLPEAVPGSAAG